jgi:hypothetical protein
LVLEHIRSIKELIGGFTFAGAPDARTLGFAKSLRDEFFENTAIAIEANEELSKTGRVTPAELRDAIAFALAFAPVAAEFGIMQQSTLHTIAVKRADVGLRGLQVYHYTKRLTKKNASGNQVLIPHLEAMKQSLTKPRKTALEKAAQLAKLAAKPAAKPAAQPPVQPPVQPAAQPAVQPQVQSPAQPLKQGGTNA